MPTVYFQRKFDKRPYGFTVCDGVVIRTAKNSQAEALKIMPGWRLVNISNIKNHLLTFSYEIPETARFSLYFSKNYVPFFLTAPLTTPNGSKTTIVHFKKQIGLKFPGYPKPSEILIYFYKGLYPLHDQVKLFDLSQSKMLRLRIEFESSYSKLISPDLMERINETFASTNKDLADIDLIDTKTMKSPSGLTGTNHEDVFLPLHVLSLQQNQISNSDLTNGPTITPINERSRRNRRNRRIRIRFLPWETMMKIVVAFIVLGDPMMINSWKNYALIMAAVVVYLWSTGILKLFLEWMAPLSLDKLEELCERKDRVISSCKNVFKMEIINRYVGGKAEEAGRFGEPLRFLFGLFMSFLPWWNAVNLN